MKFNLLLLIALLSGVMSACHKKAPAIKTTEQAAADQKAIAVRAEADQKITAQNEANALKSDALKEAAVKKAVESAVLAPSTPPTTPK